MHILMYRWKAYNYRDIEQTFLLLGHTVDNIEQELGSYDVSPEFERAPANAAVLIANNTGSVGRK